MPDLYMKLQSKKNKYTSPKKRVYIKKYLRLLRIKVRAADDRRRRIFSPWVPMKRKPSKFSFGDTMSRVFGYKDKRRSHEA